MNKQTVHELLLEGKAVDQIFDFKTVDGFRIYKSSWSKDVASDEVIYIPDLHLHELDDPNMPVDILVEAMYTTADFIDEACGNIAAAKDLFELCNWQMPNIRDLRDRRTDDAAKQLYGQTWEVMLKDYGSAKRR